MCIKKGFRRGGYDICCESPYADKKPLSSHDEFSGFFVILFDTDCATWVRKIVLQSPTVPLLNTLHTDKLHHGY